MSRLNLLSRLASSLPRESMNTSGLRGVVLAATGLLDTANRVNANFEGCRLLVHRAAELVLSVESASGSGLWDIQFPELAVRATTLRQLVEEIQAFLESLENSTWQLQVSREAEVTRTLETFQGRLTDACRALELCLMLNVHHNVSQMTRSLQPSHTPFLLQADMGTSPSSVAASALVNDLHFRTYARSEVLLTRIVYRKQGSELCEGEVEGRVVLVKRFRGSREAAANEFVTELTYWRRLWHPNLLQLIGYSKTTETPFLVMSGARLRNVVMYMGDELGRDLMLSCVTALRFAKDIVSAILHIEDTDMISAISPEFLDISNIFLDASNRLMLCDVPFQPRARVAQQYDMHTALMKAFRRICRQIVYGRDVFLHFYPPMGLECPGTHINAGYMGIIQTRLQHLMNNSGPGTALPTLEGMVEVLERLIDERDSPLGFLRLQFALHDQSFPTSSFSESFRADPEGQAELQLGDIGFLVGDVSDPRFETLCNVREHLGLVDSAGLGLTRVPLSQDERRPVDGVWRNECFHDYNVPWKFLLLNVVRIARQFHVSPEQLVLIVGITERPLERFTSSTTEQDLSVYTDLDNHDAAHFAELIRELSVVAPPSDEAGRRKLQRLRQRLAWVHLGAHQCVELPQDDVEEYERNHEITIPGSYPQD